MESKSRSDSYEEDVASKAEVAREGLLEGAIKFVDGSFKDKLDSFVISKLEYFRESAEEKTPEDAEHKLEFSDIHSEYLELFERGLESYIDEQGLTIQDFWSACQDAISDKYCAIFEEHEHHWFVEFLLSSIDYQNFFKMMIDKAKDEYGL
ncbi:unnamed protein product [Heterosigma akashiwo]|mmetsp:Transcript_23705/g.32793  ORF Transcript_23705/g.32793 Transcript_23705/m.32793 type:complete len:151 (-) Transcript_23705:244-696(-)|eukprot:CAMPEP_0194580322 /NCGR_PEP_ID=MMETSP0292-20121207/14127_1 /TAXON_ID=39354 /ORGANISM="Heterosigma akashiwo, Strain CCMP2393" /LENGTH=150 /DNA_ID=CAMNT_0039433635 /DNA_START=69 /DNA_END=521 /DNA_ORIENTATION=+